MSDESPIDTSVVGRILRRAGDLERSSELPDETSTITEASLVAAAEEVGLSADAVRRSIAVERLGVVPKQRRGDPIIGPSQIYADREVAVPADDALARVDTWLVDGHHLRRDVLRAGHGEWSKRSGIVGVTVRTIRSATGEGKLGNSERVSAEARTTAGSSSVVRVTIDRTNGRRLAGGGGAAVAVGGMTGVAVVAAVATPVVFLATPVAIAAGIGVALTGRKRARDAAREVRRLLDAVEEGAEPTRLSVDVVRRATGRATAVRSSARRAISRVAPPPPPPPPPLPHLDPPPPSAGRAGH